MAKNDTTNKTYLMINLILLQMFLVIFVASYQAFGISTSFVRLTAPILITISLASGIITIYLVKSFISILKAEAEREMELLQYKNDEVLLELMREMRHDFNNHLSIIKGLVQLGKPEKAESYIGSLDQETESYHKLMHMKNPEFAAFLLKKINEMNQKGIEYHLDINSNLNDLNISAKQIVNIFGNLIDNAVYELKKRYANRTSGKLSIVAIEEDNSLVFEVCNTAEPIKTENLEKLFQRGYTTKGNEGSGLGLHIASQSIERLNGIIEVDWSKEKGVIFRVRIPKQKKDLKAKEWERETTAS